MIEDAIRDESPAWVNANIDRETLATLERFRDAAPEKIQERIAELAWEYDVNCAATLAGSVVSLAALPLAGRNPKLLAIPAVIQGFLALGNLPIPIPSPMTSLFRVLGFRSRTEIERERHALKMLRGDYERAANDASAKGALTAAQAERGMEHGSPASHLTGTGNSMPIGEELRPKNVPTVSGPSGDPERYTH